MGGCFQNLLPHWTFSEGGLSLLSSWIQTFILFVAAIVAWLQVKAALDTSCKTNTLEVLLNNENDEDVIKHRKVFNELKHGNNEKLEHWIVLDTQQNEFEKELNKRLLSYEFIQKESSNSNPSNDGNYKKNLDDVVRNIKKEICNKFPFLSKESLKFEMERLIYLKYLEYLGDDKFIKSQYNKENLKDFLESNLKKEVASYNTAIRGVLNRYEIIAIGIKRGTLDEDMFREYYRSTVISDWQNAQGWIKKLRHSVGRKLLYVEFQRLAVKFEAEVNEAEIEEKPKYKRRWFHLWLK